MRDALGATSLEIYATRHAIRILLRQIWQAQCFCIFMHACMLVSPARRRSGSTVRVEVLRLPPLTLFALEDNQASASARTHLYSMPVTSLKFRAGLCALPACRAVKALPHGPDVPCRRAGK